MIYNIDFSPRANTNSRTRCTLGSSFLPVLSASVHLDEWTWQSRRLSWALRDWWAKARIQGGVSHDKIDDECKVNSQHNRQAWANKCAPDFVGIEGQYKVSVDEHQKYRDDPTNHLKKSTKQVSIAKPGIKSVTISAKLWYCLSSPTYPKTYIFRFFFSSGY
jgi:hypothetical protein